MTEETFTHELERRADHVQAAPLTFDAVRGRARQIRRRRRTAVAAGVAAVAIVAVAPFALGSGRDDSTPDPAPEPAVHGASVLHDGTLTLPDGGTVAIDVDNADVTQLAVLTDGRIVLATQDPYGVQVYAADGSLDATYRVRYNVITTSTRGDAVAWVEKDGTVRVLSADTSEPATWPRIPRLPGTDGNISAVLDAGHLLVDDGTTTSVEMTADGETDLETPEPFRVVEASPDGTLWSVAFLPTENEQFGCSGLYDPEARTVVARTCETSGLRFSPDGQHLLGARGDNNMYDDVDVLDLDLEDVGGYVPDGRNDVVSRAAWTDDTHVAVSVADYQSSRWWLVSHDIGGGEPEVVVPPFDGGNPELVQEFVFSE